MAVLRRISKSKKIAIELSASYTVFGRADNCDIVIENDDQLSREHCGFRKYPDDKFTVVDFGSRNGTFVNGEQIFEETELHHGDKVKFGSAEFTFINETEIKDRLDSVRGIESAAGSKDAGDSKDGEGGEGGDEPAQKKSKGSKISDALNEVEHDLEERDYGSLMKEIVSQTRKKPPKRKPKSDDNDAENVYW
jgi:pSer/pThr/pTyr-binding forkhead associated (FHA) protein